MPLTEDIGRVIAGLKGLNRTTEKDFLAVGGNLMAFLSASRKLHGDIAGLAALVSGDQAQHACDSLVSVGRYVEDMRRRSEACSRALLSLRAGADRIHRGFSTFGEIASQFRIIAIQARIEAAQLATTQQNLKNLADDVHSCSNSIRASADQVLKVAGDFEARIAATLDEGSRVETIQLRKLPSLLAEVDADVESFASRQREGAKISSELSAQMDSVARELGAVATSIQFQDITRQQLEHVIAALEDLLRDRSGSVFSSADADLMILQKTQLESAAAAFARSTRAIDRDLEGIAARVGDMVAAGNGIHGLDQKESSSEGGMQERLADIAQAVAELQALDLGTTTIVADLQGACRGMAKAVNEVQSIELELRLISVNAIVSASQIGQHGATLKVIAGAIRELGTESASRSGDARAALDSIGEAVGSLAGSYTSAGSDVSTATILADFNARVADLQSASRTGAASAANISALADTLRGDIQNARDHFSIGRVFAETASRCCALLEAVAAQARQSESSDAAAERYTHDRYTMEAERSVHRAVTSGLQDVPVEEGQEVEFF